MLTERMDLRRIAKDGLQAVLDKTDALRLDVARVSVAVEEAHGEERPMLERTHQDLSCLSSTLRREIAALEDS